MVAALAQKTMLAALSRLFLLPILASSTTPTAAPALPPTSPPTTPRGDVQLVGGITAYDGILQVWFDGEWGTVCDDWPFSDEAAEVVCQQLAGTSFESWTSDSGSCYDEMDVSVPIHLDDVECDGSEARLSDCDHSGWGVSNCVHTEDVSIVCALPTGVADAGDRTCTPELCGDPYKLCEENGLYWCCDTTSEYPKCGDSWGYCQEEGLTKKEKKSILVAVLTTLAVFFVCVTGGIVACCVLCPGCPCHKGSQTIKTAPAVLVET